MTRVQVFIEWFASGGWTMAALAAVALALCFLVVERGNLVGILTRRDVMAGHGSPPRAGRM